MIADYPVGSKLNLSIFRGEKPIEIEVVTHELGDLLGEDLECKEWGFTAKNVTKQMAVDNQLDDTLGVFVSGVKKTGPAEDADLMPGDVIKGVNEKATDTFRDFYERYTELTSAGATKVLLTVRRSGSTKFVLIKIESPGPEKTEK